MPDTDTAVEDSLVTIEDWLPLNNSYTAIWVPQQWVEMIIMKCASEIWKARKKGK